MCKKGVIWAVLVFCAISFNALAQSSDIFRLEFLNIPKQNTGTSIERYRFLLNVPIKLNWDNYLVIGTEYNRINIGLPQDLPFDTGELDSFEIIDLNLGYIVPLDQNWRLVSILTPRFASNFTEGTVANDFFFNATATLLKEGERNDKPFRLVLGLTYNLSLIHI